MTATTCDSVRLWYRVMAHHLRARLRYRLDFLFGTLEGLAFQLSTLLFVLFVLPGFPLMPGWPFGDVLFLAGFRLVAHGIYVIFFDNVQEVPDLVARQELDHYVSRPRSVFLQVSCCTIQANPLADLPIATIVLVLGASRTRISWGPVQLAELVVLLLTAVAVEAAVQVMAASVSLFNGNGWQTKLLVEEMITRFGTYPLNIFQMAAKVLLVGVVPIAFTAYFQVATLIHLSGGRRAAALCSLCAFAVAMALSARFVWHWGLRRYQGVAA